jgi:putative membrane protein
LLDELIDDGRVRTSYMNLPFGVVALGLVVRGFAGYFLEQEGSLPNLVLFGRWPVSPTQRLAIFIVGGLVVSIVGVSLASSMSDESFDEVVDSRPNRDDETATQKGK